jgi:arylsulfatase A-like enzyme
MGEGNRRDFLKAASGILLSAGALSPGLAVEKEQRHTVQPNILLFFPDQFRFDWVTGYSDNIPVRTPNLSQLAREGVWFRRAIVPSPLCAPSRACLASGKVYERCGVPSNQADYPLTERTVYSLLRDHGYYVAGCGKFDLHKKTEDWGLDGTRLLEQWGFSNGIDNAGKWDAIRSGAKVPHDPYMAYLHRRGLAAEDVADFEKRRGSGPDGCPKSYSATFPSLLPEDAYCDNWLAQNGLELMKHFPKSKPWYLAVNFTGPHNPMDITRRMARLVRGRVFPQPNGCKACTPETQMLIRENYTAMVENIDRWIGIYLDRLRERGELDNTLIVFSSDHGEMLGDHGQWGKSLPYQPSVSVPLIVAGPGVKKLGSSETLVSTMDLAATFLDYAGVSRPVDMDSLTLRPVLEGKTATHREVVSSGLGAWRMVFDGRYKLVRGFNPQRKNIWASGSNGRNFEKPATAPLLLFDLEADPHENINLAQKAGKEVRRLSSNLSEDCISPDKDPEIVMQTRAV